MIYLRKLVFLCYLQSIGETDIFVILSLPEISVVMCQCYLQVYYIIVEFSVAWISDGKLMDWMTKWSFKIVSFLSRYQ